MFCRYIVHGGSTFYEVMKVLINSWNENVMKTVHVSFIKWVQ